MEKNKRINQIIDEAAAKLAAEDVRYFIGAVDRQPKATDGGRAYALAHLTGEDFIHILDMTLHTRQDIVNLGLWVGQLLNARSGKKKKK